MKMRILGLVAAAALLTGTSVIAADGSWTGYITDNKCGAAAAHEGAVECTVKCIKEGAKYVFVTDGDKRVYTIEDQDKVAAHAGHHVKVKGTIEGDNLKVESVEMAAASKAK